MLERLSPFLADQGGVVSRQQALVAGLEPNDLRRLVRRRDLTRVHPGVYVDHTGPLSWLQSAWAAVLLYEGSALGGASAMRAAEGPGSRRDRLPVELVVDRQRHVEPPKGITVHRMVGLESRVLWNVGPPRLRYEEAALQLAASARSDFAALDELSRAVQSRRTTALRLQQALAARERITRHEWLDSVLRDVAAGTCSVLEHGYLSRIERPHGLAVARRQVCDRVAAGAIWRDVEYDCPLVVELDGRLFHNSTRQRDRDFDRDLETASGGRSSVRLSYGQVFERPCWTASHVARLLRRHGSRLAAPRACGEGCSVW